MIQNKFYLFEGNRFVQITPVLFAETKSPAVFLTNVQSDYHTFKNFPQGFSFEKENGKYIFYVPTRDGYVISYKEGPYTNVLSVLAQLLAEKVWEMTYKEYSLTVEILDLKSEIRDLKREVASLEEALNEIHQSREEQELEEEETEE